MAVELNVVILHCHFRRGGVTQVVENHVAALTKLIDVQIILVSGGRIDGLSNATLQATQQLTVAGFDYDDVVLGHQIDAENGDQLQQRAASITNRLVAALSSLGLSDADTVLHWHNHSLGKNVAAPIVIDLLDRQHGFRQLLQIHDFAEDYRPQNYLRLVAAADRVRTQFAESDETYLTPFLPADVNRYCYPNSPRIHYATLTSGDASVVERIGIDQRRIHLLPNSVSLGDDESPDPVESLAKIRRAAALPASARWCVYPVRGIRRKNVGEFLLLSRLLPESSYAGITLPPTTEIESDSYLRWRDIAAALAPKATFDAGVFQDVSFHENLAACDFVLSTSVAEGFGMAFLEPWLAGRGVIARKLPDVVTDFTSEGIRLDRFYDSVMIPGNADWIAECERDTKAAFHAAWGHLPDLYGHAWRVESSDRHADTEQIDFARLTPGRQIEVLRRMQRDDGFENAIKQSNTLLVGWLAEPFASSTLQENADAIRSAYALDVSGRRLRSIYGGFEEDHVLETSCETRMSGRALAAGNSEEPAASALPLNKSTGREDRGGVSVVNLICGGRTYFPCRTETEIAK